MEEKQKKILMYGGIGAAALVLVVTVSRKAPSGGSDSAGGVNTSQPIIIPAGGGGEDSAAIAAGLAQLADNQSALAGMIAGLEAPTVPVTPTESYEAVPGPETQAAAERTFIGNSIDLRSAMETFRGSQYHFIDTTSLTDEQTRQALQTAKGGIIVGGEGAEGGISASEAAGLGIVRIGGADRQETLKNLQSLVSSF